MKIKSVTISLFTLCAFSLSAQTTYYVDSENGNDSYPGTQDQPWATLNANAESWSTTDCILYLAEGAYDVVSKIYVNGNVEIVGAGVDKVFIQQCNDEDFEGDRFGNLPYMSTGFFDVSNNKTVKMSNLTFKNLRVGDVDNVSTPYWGGAITVQPGSSLVLNTVDFYHCIIPVGGGAGIDCKGSLDLTDVRFTECEASVQGATISLAGDAIGKFEGCSFVRNTGTTTIQVYPEETDDVCADLRFNNCYFESNDYSAAQYGCGINIGNFYGHKMIFYVTNTTFANNLGNSAGCMVITTNVEKQRVIDMKVENCIFMNNDMTTAVHSSVFSINGSSSNTLEGDITFANNIFYHNDRPEDSAAGGVSDIYITDQNVNLNFLNNIFLVTSGKGYGPVFSNDILNTKVNFRNNIFESVGGGNTTMVAAFQNQDGGIKVGQSEDEEEGLEYIDGNVDVKLDLELVSQGDYKAPYLRLQEGSVAIDAGYDDGGTLVPTLDIRGVGIYNEKKDIGAYEYDTNGSSSTGLVVSSSLKVFVTDNIVTFSEDVSNIKVFAINGTMVRDYSSAKSFDVSDWNSGTYILVVTDIEGNIFKFKILR